MAPHFNSNSLHIPSHPPPTPKNVRSGRTRTLLATFILVLPVARLNDLIHKKLLNQESETIGCDLGITLGRGGRECWKEGDLTPGIISEGEM